MKLIMVGINSPLHQHILFDLQKSGCDIVYVLGAKEQFKKMTEQEGFDRTIFHNTYDAIQGIPAQKVAWQNFEVPSKALILSLLECESQVLSMMNSVDLNSARVSMKKHLYYEYIRYWNGVLTQFQPDAIIFTDMPHVPHNFVLYTLAKQKGIKTIINRVIQIPGRMLLTQSHDQYTRVFEQLNAMKRHISVNELSPAVKEFYIKNTQDKTEDPFYMKRDYYGVAENLSRIIPTKRTIFSHIKNLKLFSMIYYYFHTLKGQKSLPALEGFKTNGLGFRKTLIQWRKINEGFEAEYKQFEQEPDLSKKYIYVPLHNQPECSTSAMGSIFVDQILMVEMLSQSIPSDWVIYVKENPLQWKMPRSQFGRYAGYYREFQKLKNVQLISTNVATFQLTKKAQAVATVTSTAGWEALLRSKPVLLFGYIWYMYCEGVFQITDVKSCKIAIQNIEQGYIPDAQKVLNFVGAMDAVSYEAFPNKRFQRNTNLNEQQNARNIVQAFKKELFSS